MRLTIFTVDAFTKDPFKGNPAAVCITGQPLGDELMQSIAGEMNLSETAFVVPQGKDGEFAIRWFTPTTEVPLCGHATLASAHVLFTMQQARGDDISFLTRFRGAVQARKDADRIALSLPSNNLRPFSNPRMQQELELALGCSALSMTQAGEDILVEIASDKALVELRPDFARLAEIPVNAVIVTARSRNGEFDFKSRYFAPRIGLNEDPVTGYAHCSLTPYWSRKLDKTLMQAQQVSARTGVLQVQMLSPNRVELLGHARTVLTGELDV